MEPVYILSLARTPIGSFGGKLSSLSATRLGAEAIQAALSKGGIQPEMVNEVFMGNVLSANLGQAPARIAAKQAGLPDNTVSTTVNKVCASGIKSIMFGAQSIMLGINDIVVAGGMESMSNTPYYLDKARYGYKMGDGKVIDGMVKDGLWDVYNDYHMGNAAENTAREKKISREAQDEYAIQSYKRAANASEKGYFKNEITPVEIKQKKGASEVIDRDEEYDKVIFEKVPHLRPVFQQEGSVTAANASTINDGAAAVVLLSEQKLKALNLTPRACIKGFADAEQAPEWFTTSPSLAIPKALKNAGISAADIDFYEINEAFSVVSIANNQLLDLDPERVNVYGGAVSLGHPLGASGARIVCTLNSVLDQNNAKTGVAGICNGGGGASALIIERC